MEEKKKVFPWKKVVIVVAVILLIVVLIPVVKAVVTAIQIVYILTPRRVDKFETVQELQAVMPDDFYYFDFEEISTPTSYEAIAPRMSNKRYISGRFEYESYRIKLNEERDDGSMNTTRIESFKCGTKRREKDFCPILDELGEITIGGIPCAVRGCQIYFFIDDVGYVIDRGCKTEEEELDYYADVEALISSRYSIDKANKAV